jgi:hypothetical protein
MDVNTLKEVYFATYCPKCKYSNNPEEADPCYNCLLEDKNEYSHKPVEFVEKEK